MFFFSSRRRHTRFSRDWSSDVCSSDLPTLKQSFGNSPRVMTTWTVTNFQARRCRPFTSSTIFIGRRKNVSCVFPRSLLRSEERRVGKECSVLRSHEYDKKQICSGGSTA